MKTTTKKGLKSLKKTAWALFSRYIRLRDCLKTTGSLTHGVCITCGRTYHINNLTAGHAIGGRSNSILYDEDCVNAQCLQCNVFNHGEYVKYKEVYENIHGIGSYQDLQIKSKQPRKYTIFELEELIESLKMRINELIGDEGGKR